MPHLQSRSQSIVTSEALVQLHIFAQQLRLFVVQDFQLCDYFLRQSFHRSDVKEILCPLDGLSHAVCRLYIYTPCNNPFSTQLIHCTKRVFPLCKPLQDEQPEPLGETSIARLRQGVDWDQLASPLSVTWDQQTKSGCRFFTIDKNTIINTDWSIISHSSSYLRISKQLGSLQTSSRSMGPSGVATTESAYPCIWNLSIQCSSNRNKVD